jgi:hypothetical protein
MASRVSTTSTKRKDAPTAQRRLPSVAIFQDHRTGHRAVCDCGWSSPWFLRLGRGPHRLTPEQAAVEAATTHLRGDH